MLSPATPSLVLYGVPLSQPFRSVAWTLLLHRMPFHIQLVVPGATSKMGSLHESFQAKTLNRSTKVPLLTYQDENTNVLAIGESPAILTHVCERYNQDMNRLANSKKSPFYGEPATQRKITMDWYMHWHHSGMRPHMAKLVEPYLRSDLNQDRSEEKRRENVQKAHEALDLFHKSWFSNRMDHSTDSNGTTADMYLGGETTPSIADILAFEEVIQVASTGLLLEDTSEKDYTTATEHLLDSKYPKISRWMNAMKLLPFYDEVHFPVSALGNLSSFQSSDRSESKEDSIARQKQLQKTMGIATKDGIKKLLDAQKSF